MGQLSRGRLRLGKIGFLNVMPIYHPLESGTIDHPFSIVSGTPAYLNGLMAEDRLDLSVVSSIEYARHPERYFILPDLSISCHGPVKSVLLLSRLPVDRLKGHKILVSSQSHTSIGLLKILFTKRFGLDPDFETGRCSESLTKDELPPAMLVIGDEALRLRHHPSYPHRLDLGEAWHSWTRLPFVFALWVIQRRAVNGRSGLFEAAMAALAASKRWGRENIGTICELAAAKGIMNSRELLDYYDCLGFDLGRSEREGLDLFFRNLFEIGELTEVPRLEWISPLASVA